MIIIFIITDEVSEVLVGVINRWEAISHMDGHRPVIMLHWP